MKINAERLTASHSDAVTVFIIGMRINRLFALNKWLPVARSMGPMVAELAADPDSGFLGAETMRQGFRTVLLVQYWRDFNSLERYARDRDRNHWPAWTAFNKAVGSDGTVGIFHETYVVSKGCYESIYNNMPAWGLGAATGLAPATGSRNAARSRMNATTST
jgi:hypothetical protein